MVSLKPFFTFYGGKWRVAPKYPEPTHDIIVEPFAGSAGYSLRYPERVVWLNDLDPIIAETWDYLIGADESEILRLPDLSEGQSVDHLDLPQGARYLIGWWLNKGSATPKKTPSSFMMRYPQGGPYWGQGIRERIASQLQYIRHWRVTQLDYENLSNIDATWFIDPPYVGAGHHYRFGNKEIDFPRMGRWCRSRYGQVIVCEADTADWLPFVPLAEIDGTEGRQKVNRARTEVVWISPEGNQERTLLPLICQGCGYYRDTPNHEYGCEPVSENELTTTTDLS